MSRAALVLDNKTFTGWEEFSVTRALPTLSGTFQFRAPNVPGLMARSIAPGLTCAVELIPEKGDKELVITGCVETSSYTLSGSHALIVGGRDLTGDLVDCSAVLAAGKIQWTGRKIEDIVRDLISPFSIRLKSNVDTGPVVPNFILDRSETVLSAIQRLANFRSLLFTSSGSGEVVIEKVGQAVFPDVITPENGCVSIAASVDFSKRFSKYVCRAYAEESNGWTPAGTFVESSCVDPAIKRHRPKLLIADDIMTRADLAKWASWAARYSSGQSESISVTVSGWSSKSGAIWKPNYLARVVAPEFGIDADLLIEQVRYSQGANGTLTDMVLVPATAYDNNPVARLNTKKPEVARYDSDDIEDGEDD